MKRLKKYIVNFTILICVSMIALLLAEGVTRYFYKDSTILYPRYQTEVNYGDFVIRKLRPNTVFWHTSVDGHWRFETNSKGFRNNRDFSYHKPEGVVRILSIGDSHTEGFEARQDHTFSSVIGKTLREHGVAAEVINSGISGFSNAEELVFLENEGIKYHPDYVVLGFFGNDFQDNIKAGIFALNKKSQLIVKKHTYIPGVKIQDFIYSIPGVQWLSENSYFYSMLFNNVWEFFKHYLTREKVSELVLPEKGDVPQAYEHDLAYKLLQRMYFFCRTNNIKLIIIDIPFPLRKGDAPVTLQNQGLGSSFPAKWMGKIDAISDAVVYASSVLQKHGDELILVPHGDRHISEFTHRVFGQAVSKIILGWNK